MFGLFNRARPRLAAPACAWDEGRMSLAEIEALLREIAADQSNRGAAADGEPSRSNDAEARRGGPKLAA